MLGVGVAEYFRQDAGNVFVIPFTLHLGLAKRVELMTVFPYIQLRQKFTGDIETFGDILVYLKFKMKNFYFRFPFSENYAFNQWDLVFKFNTATGPSLQEEKDFTPYSIGLADFSAGFFYTTIVNNFSVDLNFIYTFAAHIGEEYLPFSSKIWDSSTKSYFFDIHKVIVKFLWPGKYPWAPEDKPDDDKSVPVWEKFPHADDYFNLDLGFNYTLTPNWSLFTYDLFFEINWLKSWHEVSVYQQRILLTPGLQVNITETFLLIGSVSVLMPWKGWPWNPVDKFYNKYYKDFYFNNLYYLGLRIIL